MMSLPNFVKFCELKTNLLLPIEGVSAKQHPLKNPQLILDRKQGGSVMCVRTLSFDPTHLHFSLNCLPNEEEIKKINILTYHSTNY